VVVSTSLLNSRLVVPDPDISDIPNLVVSRCAPAVEAAHDQAAKFHTQSDGLLGKPFLPLPRTISRPGLSHAYWRNAAVRVEQRQPPIPAALQKPDPVTLQDSAPGQTRTTPAEGLMSAFARCGHTRYIGDGCYVPTAD
jgi:hypothetical protein